MMMPGKAVPALRSRLVLFLSRRALIQEDPTMATGACEADPHRFLVAFAKVPHNPVLQ